MDHSALSLNSKERQQWVKVTGLKTKYDLHLKTMRIRVMAPYLFGEEFLPIKWQQWADEATLTTYTDKWLEVEPVDVDEYYKMDYLSDSIHLVANQVLINLQSDGGDFQRLLDLVVKLDKVSKLSVAKDIAEEEVVFERLWNRLSPVDEETKVALMIAVHSYIQFAADTVRKKDLLGEMTFLDPRDRKLVEDFKSKGNEEHKNNHYSKAVALYNKAIRISRYDHNLYNNRSLAFLNMKRFNHALLDAKRALTINPNSSKAHYRYSQALFELGYIKLALKFNSTAIEIFKKGSHKDSSVRDLESQRMKFDERIKATPCLDDVPDLVDPSSSDSEFSDMEQGEVDPPRGAVNERQNVGRHKVFTTEDQKAALKYPRRQRSESTKKQHEEKKAKRRKQKEMSEEEKKRAESEKQREEKAEARRHAKEDEEKEIAKKREEVRARVEAAQAAQAETAKEQEKEDKEREEDQKALEKLQMEKVKMELERMREENERRLEEEAKKREAAMKDQQKAALNAEHLKEMEEKNEIESQLRHGSEAMIEQRGRQAFMYYKTAMDLITKSSKKYGGMCEEDYVTFLYAYGMACLESGIDEEIVDASSKFLTIIENHNRIRIPLPYYGLCQALLKQNKFSELDDPLGKAKYMAEKFTSVVETWPGTKHKIKVTEEGEMEIALKDLESIFKHPPAPDAICRYTACSHKPEIYLTDLGFKGYVKVICSERCHMDYHVTCWKKVKEEYFDASTEKEILGKSCGTPDCDGYFISVAVLGPDGLCITKHVLSDSDKTKDKKNKGASKQYTKKNRKMRKQEEPKKQVNEKGQGSGDNEKADLDDREEHQEGEKKTNKEKKLETEQAELSPKNLSLTSSDAMSTTSSNTADGGDEGDEEDNDIDEDEGEEEDVQVEAVYILKKEDYSEDAVAKAVRPKTRKKKAKDTVSMPIEVKFKSGPSRDNMVSADKLSNFHGEVKSTISYPVLDPDQPFAVPPNLQEAASKFEENFNTKMVEPMIAGAQSQEEMSQITALRLHFEEVLGRLGPVPITDTHLGDELQSMPFELQAIVDRFGGLDKFLLDSPNFKMIEDHVCLLQDVHKCKGIVEVAKASRVKPASKPVSTNFGGRESYWSNTRANLAPENFPDISEALASSSVEPGQKKPAEAATPSKMDTLEDFFLDSEENRAARMLSVLDGINKIETKSNIGTSGSKENEQASEGNSETHKLTTQLTDRQRHLRTDGVEAEPELVKASPLSSPVDDTSPDQAQPTTSILNEIFFPHKVNAANKQPNKNNQSVSLPSGSQSGVIKGSEVKGASNKASNYGDDKLAFGTSISLGTDTCTSKASDVLKDSSLVFPTNSKITKSEELHESDSLLLWTASMATEQVPVDKAGVVDREESGFYSTSSESSVLSSSSNSNSVLHYMSASSHLSCESHSSDQESVKDAQSNSIVRTTINASSDEGTVRDSLPNQEDQRMSTVEKTSEPHQMDAPAPASAPLSSENASLNQEQLDTSKPNPPEAPLVNQDVVAASTVSIAKYNELLQKYKMIYEACKSYTERKMSLKCTWTQCPRPSTQTKALNTDPTMMMQLIASSPQVSRLQTDLDELRRRSLESENLYRSKEKKLSKELATAKNERKEARNWVDSLEFTIKRKKEENKLLEMEKGDAKAEVFKRDKKIKELEQKIAKLNEEIKSKDEQSEATAKKMQTEKDLWLAEKMKMEETSASVIMSVQMTQKRCQEAEIMVLRLQCARDLVAVEEAIRDCDNQLIGLNHVFRSGRGSNLTENQRELINAWEKSLEDNTANAATLKDKYEEYILKIKSGHSLNQLPAIEPPKPVRPSKFQGMPPHVTAQNMQHWGPRGVGMPFGMHMNGGTRNIRMPPPNQMSLPNQMAPHNQMAPPNQMSLPNQMAQHNQMAPPNQMTPQNQMAPSIEMLKPGQMAPPFQMASPDQMAPSGQMAQHNQMSLQSTDFGLANHQHVDPRTPSPAPATSNTAAAAGSTNQYQRGQQPAANPQQSQASTQEREPTLPSVPVSMGLSTQLSGFTGGQAPPKEAAYPGSQTQGHAPPDAAKIPVSLAEVHPPWLAPTTTAVRMLAQSTGLQSSQFHHQQGVRQHQPQGQPQIQSKSPVTVTYSSGPRSSVMPTSQALTTAQAAAQKPTPVKGAAGAPAQPRSNFDKIIFPLQNMFPEFNKVQLTKVIKDVRAANNGSLSGLSIEEIIHRAAELILNQQKPSSEIQRVNTPPADSTQGGGATSKRPLNGIASSSLKWEPAKQPPKSAWAAKNLLDRIDFEEEEDPCVICHEEMHKNLVTLRCGHKFHPYCIRLWLQEQRTCPTCRNYTLLPDEYPAPIKKDKDK